MKLKKTTGHDPAHGFMNQRRNILSENSAFPIREAYKAMRTNIQFSLPKVGCRKICITSGLSSEGKSITTLNTAISFAEAGQKVLLIDADMRRPSMARLLIENGAPGLSNVLAGLCSEEQAVRKDRYPNLDVLFSGEIPPNPSELLGSTRMAEMLERLAPNYDYIIIDSPPVDIVTDACVISRVVDGVLFVVRENQSERESVTHGLNQLNIAGAKLLGFILTAADVDADNRFSKKKRYSIYRYDSYGYEPPMRSWPEQKKEG